MDNEQIKEYIDSILNKIESKEAFTDKELDKAIDSLESLECWNPLIKLLNSILPKTDIRYYNKLCQVYVEYVKDVEKASEVCFKTISHFHLKYPDFQKFLQPILEEDYEVEANILQRVYSSFERLEDKEKALERLSLLYDKKLSNTEGVQDVCNTLLQINPLNLKALKFFKMVYIQVEQWDKVCDILTRMIRGTNSKQNIYRFAQELAGVYLYQLGRPKEAIRIIEQYCYGSPLDCSFILFEAYKELSDWKNCIKVLEQLLKEVSDEEKAIVYFKMARVYENLGRWDLHEKTLLKAMSCDETFLEPLEQIIYSKVFNKEWKELVKVVDLLINKIKNVENKNKFIELKTRLASSLLRAR